MKRSQQSTDESSSLRTFTEDAELYEYIGQASAVPILIHVVGSEKKPRLLITPASAKAHQHADYVFWAAGANCGEWKVTFDKGAPSPLDPPGPYSSSGPIGGFATGDVGTYPYSVEAVDLRSGRTVDVDPDLVIVM